MTFCQIVLRKGLVDGVTNDLDNKPPWWKEAVEAHRRAHPNDPIPIPVHDPEPQVTIPATFERPWHTQIHRDAFSYGEAGPRVDPRLVVDLRFFGMQEGVPKNKLVFEREIRDVYDMPQATFEYTPTDEFALQATRMMNDMTDVANALGGYLPDSYPQFMTPGLALHLGGTVRLGHSEKDGSVADYNSQVWKFKNLFVAGNGVIPTSFGANPTLTSMCLAIRSAYIIFLSLNEPDTAQTQLPTKSAVKSNAVVPTPDSWLRWALDKNDPNYTHHERLRPPHRYVSV